MTLVDLNSIYYKMLDYTPPPRFYRLLEKFVFLTDEMVCLNANLPTISTCVTVDSLFVKDIVTEQRLVSSLAINKILPPGVNVWCALIGVNPITEPYSDEMLRTLSLDATKLLLAVENDSLIYVNIEDLPTTFADVYDKWGDEAKRKLHSSLLNVGISGENGSSFDFSIINESIYEIRQQLKSFDFSKIDELLQRIDVKSEAASSESISDMISLITEIKTLSVKLQGLPTVVDLISAQCVSNGETIGACLEKLNGVNLKSESESVSCKDVIQSLSEVKELLLEINKTDFSAQIDALNTSIKAELSKINTNLVNKDVSETLPSDVIDNLKDLDTKLANKVDQMKNFIASSNLLHSMFGVLC